MEQVHVVDAEQTTPYAFLVNERKHMTKSIQKEMLEQQQSQLVSGLREMYRKLQMGETWPGAPLKESHGGFPLTHDILERLQVLHSSDSPMKNEVFEDDLDALQERCMRANGPAQNPRRRRATSEESEPGLTSSASSSHGMSSPAQSIAFPDAIPQHNTPSTPTVDNDFYQSFNRKPQFAAVATSQPMSFNPSPAALLQQSWASQQLPLEQTMDVDMYSYNPTLSCDPQLFSNPGVFGNQDPMTASWPESFDQLINPSALQTV
ncbi:uncharacterized protein PV09_05963 [Verruconis gallopava]|uniref:Uncharacterized protein n=1 Tax=Verruconis gallopava TaxID=253628 RepID=A0A0D1YQQ8_9PEZI|nr:uncharacterized protein PV09_05963 [Verruconis gallopava]KIW02917.1 hypothetical protein PV09_05963 [Verruconis gallopava]